MRFALITMCLSIFVSGLQAAPKPCVNTITAVLQLGPETYEVLSKAMTSETTESLKVKAGAVLVSHAFDIALLNTLEPRIYISIMGNLKRAVRDAPEARVRLLCAHVATTIERERRNYEHEIRAADLQRELDADTYYARHTFFKSPDPVGRNVLAPHPPKAGRPSIKKEYEAL